MPNNFIFISLYFILSKGERRPRPSEGTSTNNSRTQVYANSLLATLNTRLEVKGRGTYDQTIPSFIMHNPDTSTRSGKLGGPYFPVLQPSTLLVVGVFTCMLSLAEKLV